MTARIEQHTATVVAHGLTLSAVVECVVIRCDGAEGCDATHATPGSAEDAATVAAAALGWTWDGGVIDGCPLHPVGGER
ncbi:MAG: hypothetical protein EPO40_16570 [Myxococcaceae bacterium]|nr:MAG: hypothetical protein EPO40_16570 [Myxococcaceae bacterium]